MCMKVHLLMLMMALKAVQGLSERRETGMPFLEMVLTIDKIDTFLDGRLYRKDGKMTAILFS